MEKKVLTVAAKDENLQKVLELAEAAMEECGCPMKLQIMTTICLEEMAVNVFHYAYPDDPEAEKALLTVEIQEDDGFLEITLIDSGIPYNPLEKEDPDITLSAEERGIGGLGIYMTKQKMDEVSYRYEDGKNIFTMKKRMN